MDPVSYLPQGHMQSKKKLVNKSVLDLVGQGRKDLLCMSGRNSHAQGLFIHSGYCHNEFKGKKGDCLTMLFLLLSALASSLQQLPVQLTARKVKNMHTLL